MGFTSLFLSLHASFDVTVEKKTFLLVDTGFGISDLVERRHLEAVSVPPLTLVHEVSEGQHHLKQLLQVSTV